MDKEQPQPGTAAADRRISLQCYTERNQEGGRSSKGARGPGGPGQGVATGTASTTAFVIAGGTPGFGRLRGVANNRTAKAVEATTGWGGPPYGFTVGDGGRYTYAGFEER